MKHKKHEDRKSFKHWAMKGQRVETDDKQRYDAKYARHIKALNKRYGTFIG